MEISRHLDEGIYVAFYFIFKKHYPFKKRAFKGKRK
jgi:hypothetical protein